MHILINHLRKKSVTGVFILIPHQVIVKQERIALELFFLPVTEIGDIFGSASGEYKLIADIRHFLNRLIQIGIACVIGTADRCEHQYIAVGVFNFEFHRLPKKIHIDQTDDAGGDAFFAKAFVKLIEHQDIPVGGKVLLAFIALTVVVNTVSEPEMQIVNPWMLLEVFHNVADHIAAQMLFGVA